MAGQPEAGPPLQIEQTQTGIHKECNLTYFGKRKINGEEGEGERERERTERENGEQERERAEDERDNRDRKGREVTER